jgi:hypothetical protein
MNFYSSSNIKETLCVKDTDLVYTSGHTGGQNNRWVIIYNWKSGETANGTKLTIQQNKYAFFQIEDTTDIMAYTTSSINVLSMEKFSAFSPDTRTQFLLRRFSYAAIHMG